MRRARLSLLPLHCFAAIVTLTALAPQTSQPSAPRPDLAHQPTLYVVGYADNESMEVRT